MRMIARAVNNTYFAQPTSAQFGRMVKDKDIWYVTFAAGLAFPIGGQIVAVDTREDGY